MDTAERLNDFYGKHWNTDGAYDGPEALEFQKELFREMFPGYESREFGERKLILDVGCGSGIAGRAFFGNAINRNLYYCIDPSDALDRAQAEFARLGLSAVFRRWTIGELPAQQLQADYVFCPGVLHYTPNMLFALHDLAAVLRDGGELITWIYKKQPRLRAATDACLREYFSKMPAEEALRRMEPLTKLGIALGELKQTITVPEDIFYLGIKAGTYDLQRFIYYHILKLFYHPDLPFVRHNVNNWNAYFPSPVHFLDPQTIYDYVEDAGFRVHQWREHGNGIAIIAHKS